MNDGVRTCEICGRLFAVSDDTENGTCPHCSTGLSPPQVERLPQFIGTKAAHEVNCSQCQKPMLMPHDIYLARCPHCHKLIWRRPEVIATTTLEIPGYQIAAILDVVTAERAMGMHILKELLVDIRDIVGGRSGTTEATLRELRQQCLDALRTEAKRIGGNAVIGIDLDFSEFSGKGMTMLFLVASGTAVYAVPSSAAK